MLENFEQKTEISNVHFLVHPGYMVKNKTPYYSSKNMVELIQNYTLKAKTLKSDELMVLFAPVENDKKFIQGIRKGQDIYVDIIKKIKEILGKRLIVLGNNGEAFAENKEEVWARIKNIAEKRGFPFKKNLTAEAYGEYINACVAAVAMNMHSAAKMPKSKPVKIRAEITDFIVRKQKQDELNKDKYPNTKLDFSRKLNKKTRKYI